MQTNIRKICLHLTSNYNQHKEEPESRFNQSLDGATEPAVDDTEQASNVDAVHIIDLTLKTANMLNHTSIIFATTVEINYHTTLDALQVDKGAIHVDKWIIYLPSVVHQIKKIST